MGKGKKHMTSFTGWLMVVVIFFGVIFFTTEAWVAEDKFPSGPITLICGYGAGGQTDLSARLLARSLEKYLKVPVIVVNKPGAGEVIAGQMLTGSNPDGHTLAVLSIGGLITGILLGNAPYKTEDLRVIGQYSIVSTAMGVKADAPWKTMEEFIDYAKKNPGTTYGHPGLGTASHLRVEYLNKVMGLKLKAVPFKDDPSIIMAVLGRHVPIATFSYTALKPQLEAGTIRALLSFDPEGFELDPSIRTFESVFGKEIIQPPMPRTHLVAPSKIPEKIIQTLQKTLEQICKDPEFRQKMKNIYLTVQFIGGYEADKKINQMREQIREIFKDLEMIK
jgi:tripartite-type tricarboxylate transporter receptor subunit TctC